MKYVIPLIAGVAGLIIGIVSSPAIKELIDSVLQKPQQPINDKERQTIMGQLTGLETKLNALAESEKKEEVVIGQVLQHQIQQTEELKGLKLQVSDLTQQIKDLQGDPAKAAELEAQVDGLIKSNEDDIAALTPLAGDQAPPTPPETPVVPVTPPVTPPDTGTPPAGGDAGGSGGTGT